MKKELNINDIIVNPKNPRHIEAMPGDELLAMKKLLEASTDINKMYDLICNLFRNGWFEELMIAVVYDSNLNKYVAWDGNRRLTALKILQNPQIAKSFNFSKKQFAHINIMATKVDKSLFNVNCSIKDDFYSLAQYILSIHTKESSGVSWDPEAKNRFEHLYGNKNKTTYQIFKDEFPDLFNNMKINTSTFERIITSSSCKKFLKYKINNNIITHDLDNNEFNNQLHRIINDIALKKIHSRNMNKVLDISNYLYKNIIPGIINNTNSSIVNNNTNKSEKDEKQFDMFDKNIFTENINSVDKSNFRKNELDQINSDNNNVPNIKKTIDEIKPIDDMPFIKINIKNLNHDIEQSKGIHNLAYELQNMSRDLYKSYPIAYTFLIRSIFEQTIIYFISKKGFISHITNANSNRIDDLGKLIAYVTKYKDNLITDLTIKKLWDTCFNNYAMKDYMDIIIHNPHKIKANPHVIKLFLDTGLFLIIQYFINS